MLVGAVENDLSLERIVNTLHEMRERRYEVDNIEIERSNFWSGSHFLKLYYVKNYKTLDLPKNVAVLHTSSNEMRNLLREFVREKAEEIKTLLGTTWILRGGDAREYEKRCKYSSEFSKRKRQLLFEEVFDGETIANHTTMI